MTTLQITTAYRMINGQPNGKAMPPTAKTPHIPVTPAPRAMKNARGPTSDAAVL